MEKRNKNGLTEQEFLAQYNPGDYERPSVTVDMLVLKMKEDLSCMQALFIQRKDHPFIDCWALPGGFVGIDESAYEAACRELQEETNLTNVYLEQVYTMTQPKRDPRMRVIDVAYMALLPYGEAPSITAGDDARDTAWFDIQFTHNNLILHNENRGVRIEYSLSERVFKNGKLSVKNYVPASNSEEKLAFDHSEIVLEALMKLREQVMYTDVAFNLIPDSFTLPDLQRVYETILGKDLYKANFREKIENKVTKLDKKGKPLTSQRTSQLYMYNGV